MNTTERVVFRCYENQSPQWEAYGIDSAVYGSGEELTEARADIKSAIALLHEVDEACVEIDEFHEHLARPADAEYPDIWIRTLHDNDTGRMLARREVAERIKAFLAQHPQYARTFSNGVASTGDVVASVVLPDDMLIDSMGQVGESDCLYICMPKGHKLYWQTLFTSEFPALPQNATPVASLELGDCATVEEFMNKTHAEADKAANFLVSA